MFGDFYFGPVYIFVGQVKKEIFKTVIFEKNKGLQIWPKVFILIIPNLFLKGLINEV